MLGVRCRLMCVIMGEVCTWLVVCYGADFLVI